MAGIRTAIELTDRMTQPLRNINNALNSTISAMESAQRAGNGFAGVDFGSIRRELNSAGASLNSINNDINDARGSMEGMQTTTRNVGTGFAGWQKAIITANAALGLVRGTLGRLGVFDLSGAFGRIDTMNRFDKTVTTLTGDAGQAKAALEQLKSATQGTAYGLDTAAKATQGFVTRGMNLTQATDQVKTWADAVAFYGEGTNEQLESAVTAVGKIYSKGRVDAEQMDMLYTAGIPAAELYAKRVNKSVAQVKQDLSDGKITAADFIGTVTEAMKSGDAAGAAKKMGNSWANTFANMRAAFSRGWVNVIQNVDNSLASHGLPSTMQMIKNIGTTIETALTRSQPYIDLMVGGVMQIANLGRTIAENWSVIAPIVMGVAAAYLLYNTVGAVSAAITGIIAAIQGVQAASAAMSAGATFLWTVQQYGLNAALLACPITWIIAGIIAVIACLVAVANYVAKTSKVAKNGFSVIVGWIFVAGTAIKNLGIGFYNVGIVIGNTIATLCSNIITAFHNAIQTVKSTFYSLQSTVFEIIAKIAEGLNKLPFVKIDYKGLKSKADSYAKKSEASKADKKAYKNFGKEWNKNTVKYDSYTKAYKNGAKLGNGISDKVGGALKKFKAPKVSAPKTSGAGKLSGSTKLGGSGSDLGNIKSNTGNTANNTARMADALDITSENLKYIRDYASRKAINRYTNSTITIDMTNNNSINNNNDIDGIVNQLKDSLVSAMASSAEGVV